MKHRLIASLVLGLSMMLCGAAAPAPVQVAMATSAVCPHLEFAAVEAQGGRVITGPDGSSVHVDKTPVVSMTDFTSANVTLTEGQIVLNVSLTGTGGARVQTFTKDHVGARVAFIEDDHAIKVMRILDPIKGDGILAGPFERAEADALAAKINRSVSLCGARG